MYKRILVPLDGSAFAEASLPLALALAAETQAGLHLVSVVAPIPTFAYSGWEPAAIDWSAEYLESVAARISASAGGGVTTAVQTGPVVEVLLEEVKAGGVDLVIMATHGRGALSRAWLGSVADAFMRHSETPVLFVRPEEGDAPAPEASAGFKKLLVPLDGSELSESALEHATALGELFGSAYHLLRMITYPIDIASPYLPTKVQVDAHVLADAKASAAEYLEAHAERMTGRGLRVTVSVSVDPQAAHGILEAADAEGCDLIVMSTHGRGGVGRVLLGSAADKVLRGTDLPLLLYRPPRGLLVGSRGGP